MCNDEHVVHSRSKNTPNKSCKARKLGFGGIVSWDSANASQVLLPKVVSINFSGPKKENE